MATLSDIIARFKQASGRYDLTDEQIIQFIDDGRILLDSLVAAGTTVVTDDFPLENGDYYVEVQNCRAVLQVYSVDNEGNTIVLERYSSYEDFIEDYPNVPASDKGTPVCYAVVGPRQVEGANTSRMVLFAPAAEAGVTLRVVSRKFSKKLTSPTDTNFWSEAYPAALVYAACWALENLYRNTEGANSWRRALQPYIQGLDADVAEGQAEGRRYMGDG